MARKCKIFLIWLGISVVWKPANTQSTSANPPGQCAGYINRYTHDNQCVYSFTVPKQHQNDCKGQEADLKYLLRENESVKAEIEQIQNNIQVIEFFTNS